MKHVEEDKGVKTIQKKHPLGQTKGLLHKGGALP